MTKLTEALEPRPRRRRRPGVGVLPVRELRARDRAVRRSAGRAGSAGPTRMQRARGGVLRRCGRRSSRCRSAAASSSARRRIRRRCSRETELGAGGEKVDLAIDPLEGRGVVARGGYGAMSMVAVGEPDSLMRLPDMYMRKMAVGPAAREPIDLGRPVGGQHPGDRRLLRPPPERHHRDRPRPAAPPRPDRGDPGRRRADQAHPGRRRDRIHLRRDPRDERPSRDRHRRDAAGGPVSGRVALSRRRAAGAALADVPLGDRGCARARDRGHDAGVRAGRLHAAAT